MNPRTVRAGWKLAGLQPWDRGRIHALPQVQNLRNQTPDLIPPTHPGVVYSTPKHSEAVRQLQTVVDHRVTPHTSRHVQKLANAAVETMGAYQAVKEELSQVRKRQRDQDEAKMTKRIKEREKQRVWAIKEIIESNARMDEPIRCWKVRKMKKKFIIAFRLPLEAYTSLTLDI
jgi:tryptophan 2,3-dioxygenase